MSVEKSKRRQREKTDKEKMFHLFKCSRQAEQKCAAHLCLPLTVTLTRRAAAFILVAATDKHKHLENKSGIIADHQKRVGRYSV